MNDTEIPERESSGSWIANLAEGGLPQILAGPAGKAISRLIGAGADVPAAYLKGLSQGARDKSEARSKVTRAIADKAAQLAVDDPAIMERAIHGMLSKSYRIQENRENVAKVAVEELSKAPPPDESKGPSDDWMNKFERYAEDASGDDIRQMFGRLLAEEVRNPGKISSATMRFIADMDSDVAKLIQRTLPACSSQGPAFLDAISPSLEMEDLLILEQAGFWRTRRNMRYEIKISTPPFAYVIVREHDAIALELSAGVSLELESAFLSKPARDLLAITEVEFDFDSFEKLAKENSAVLTVQRKHCARRGDGWIFSDK